MSLAHSFSSRLWPSSSAICVWPRQQTDSQRSTSTQMVPRRSETYMEVGTPSRFFFKPLSSVDLCSAFEHVPVHQFPPHRRITQDEAPSMMPLPAQNATHQGVGGVYAGQTAAVGGNGHSRKKARLGWRSRSYYLSCDMAIIRRNTISSQYFSLSHSPMMWAVLFVNHTTFPSHSTFARCSSHFLYLVMFEIFLKISIHVWWLAITTVIMLLSC